MALLCLKKHQISFRVLFMNSIRGLLSMQTACVIWRFSNTSLPRIGFYFLKSLHFEYCSNIQQLRARMAEKSVVRFFSSQTFSSWLGTFVKLLCFTFFPESGCVWVKNDFHRHYSLDTLSQNDFQRHYSLDTFGSKWLSQALQPGYVRVKWLSQALQPGCVESKMTFPGITAWIHWVKMTFTGVTAWIHSSQMTFTGLR